LERLEVTGEGNNHHPVICDTRLRVRYAETDQMGVVYHANHFIWFEVGRVEFMRQMGLSYVDMEKEGCHMPVVDARCRYKSPARYDDEIIVRTHIKYVRQSMVQFGYDLLRASDGEVLAEGDTTHILIDAQMNKVPIPEKCMKVFQEAMGE
jgi:acyl-CoA thioester hydrolase